MREAFLEEIPLGPPISLTTNGEIESVSLSSSNHKPTKVGKRGYFCRRRGKHGGLFEG